MSGVGQLYSSMISRRRSVRARSLASVQVARPVRSAWSASRICSSSRRSAGLSGLSTWLPSFEQPVNPVASTTASSKTKTRRVILGVTSDEGQPTSLTIIQTMQILPLAEAKARLSELVAQIQQQHDEITITRNGRAAAVMVPIEEWEGLHETLEILSDSETVAALRRARDEIERGEVHTTEEVLAAFHERRKRNA
ncbi:MAG: type II toxin-antitoxin system prevent-host-death family antitoxin [Streptosporangiales bacterium]|nr:type II toxin-antitoxin system prevent-host-death family antitoxin [Streptosporangiales bacterium]